MTWFGRIPNLSGSGSDVDEPTPRCRGLDVSVPFPGLQQPARRGQIDWYGCQIRIQTPKTPWQKEKDENETPTTPLIGVSPPLLRSMAWPRFWTMKSEDQTSGFHSTSMMIPAQGIYEHREKARNGAGEACSFTSLSRDITPSNWRVH